MPPDKPGGRTSPAWFSPGGSLVRGMFRLLLAGLGLGLEIACRVSPSFRSQVTRDVTIEVASADGVAHHYHFAPRSVASRSGRAADPALAVCFADAGQGLRALISPHAIGKIIDALLQGGAFYRGNAVLVLWFFPLTRYVLPVGRVGPLTTALPDGYTAHNPASRVASRITIEPPVESLDPDWHDAHVQRAKMVMTRGSAGEKVAMW